MFNSPSKSVQTDALTRPCPCWNLDISKVSRPDEFLEAEACLHQCKRCESQLRRLRKKLRQNAPLQWWRLFVVISITIFSLIWLYWWLRTPPPPPPPEISLWKALYALLFEDFWKTLETPLV